MAKVDLLAEQTVRLLDAADDLFYANGVRSVGMDQIRAASGVSLKRIYQLFRTKSDLHIATLARRDIRWRGDLAEFVERFPDSDRVPAIFDWLHQWFSTSGFRGCAWINTFGELGEMEPDVVNAVRAHKRAFHDFVARNVVAAGLPESVAPAVCLLAEGAIVNASIANDASQAIVAKEAVTRLLSRH